MKGAKIDRDVMGVGEDRRTIQYENNKRVDLFGVSQGTGVESIPPGPLTDDSEEVREFINVDIGKSQDYKTLNYNNNLRQEFEAEA